jgi:hypothetical protein
MSALPAFTTRVINPDDKRLRDTVFACICCRAYDVVDVSSGLCRPCWRVAVLAPAVDAADEPKGNA